METQFSRQDSRLTAVTPGFLLYARAALQYSDQTIVKYTDCLRQVGRMIGDCQVADYSKGDVINLQAEMLRKNHSIGRQVSILAAFKRLLQYCQQELALPVLDPTSIVLPHRPRRQVTFLRPEEVTRFVASIRLRNLIDQPLEAGFRFRALVEALLGSAMRIGELLSLDRVDIDHKSREARVIGKGNKQRTVFFTDRALVWISNYLDIRTDTHPALFATLDGRSRLSRDDIWRPFSRCRRLAGINKPVTPHLLRHTAATQLLFNGCPIGHIKDILGHERLETTCRYYLGLDQRAAKQAFQKYLVYEPSLDQIQ